MNRDEYYHALAYAICMHESFEPETCIAHCDMIDCMDIYQGWLEGTDDGCVGEVARVLMDEAAGAH